MIKKLLFFDSEDGIKNYDANATNSNVQYYHPYNLYFRLSNPIININRQHIFNKKIQEVSVTFH